MLRKRIESFSKFSIAEVKRFNSDVNHLSEFFQLDSEYKEPAVGSGGMETSNEVIGSDGNVDPQCVRRCGRAVAALKEVRDLLVLSVESEDFVVLCRSLVRRYSLFEEGVSRDVDYHTLFRYRDMPRSNGAQVSQNLLTSICMHIRPDSNDRIAHLIQIIHDNHGNTLGGLGHEDTSVGSHNEYSDDLLVRVFANKPDEDGGGLASGMYHEFRP
jgi:hypothetical protein